MAGEKAEQAAGRLSGAARRSPVGKLDVVPLGAIDPAAACSVQRDDPGAEPVRIGPEGLDLRPFEGPAGATWAAANPGIRT